MIVKKEKKSGRTLVIIYSGEMYVATEGELIQTTVGGCISVVLRNDQTGTAGMNHFMLPSARTSVGYVNQKSDIYGVNAVSNLLELMKKTGGSLKGLTAMIFGGANFTTEKSSESNIILAKVLLESADIPIIKEEIWGGFARKIVYDSHTGKVFIQKINSEVYSGSN